MEKNKVKPFQKPDVLKIAKNVLKCGPVCDHCLGRQLAQVSTGMTNKERGVLLRKILKKNAEKRKCVVCGDLFRKLDDYAQEAAQKLGKVEFRTFVVGTRLSSEIIAREESLWEEVGIERCESIRSELNRELGKLIFARVKKAADELNPDVVVMLNLQKERIDVSANPIFIKGFYKKLVRGIPQTKWDQYAESVEDIIAGPVMDVSGGIAHSMHASGREDIDARCLDWRPFVLEIKNPIKRTMDLKKIQLEIKRSKKVEVSGLEFTGRKDVAALKSERPDKSYKVVVDFEKPVKDIGRMKKIVGIVSQRTPLRVSHRRADLVRKRKVVEIKWKRINNKSFELQIKGEAGLYIKELVTGDGGRTRPSISELLGNPAVVRSLDVVRIWK